MNDAIRQLLALQARDLDLDRLTQDSAAIPAKIAALKKQIDDLRQALTDSKKELTQLQMRRKEKEVDLDAREGAIRKHAAELNAVKSNDAYRALLSEIDAAKKQKSDLEDEILKIMDDTEAANRTWKSREAESKTAEGAVEKQIADLDARQRELTAQIAEKREERTQALAGLPKALADQYERLRKANRGAAVVPLRAEQCSGCHMRVSPNLINEVRRGQKLMACESCSRIVYLEEVPTP